MTEKGASSRIGYRRATGILLFVLASALAAMAADVPPAGAIDSGFRLLYSLKFDDAQRVFSQWQHDHPDDPVGPVSEAAGLLFSEFNRLGILETQFFEDDKAFGERRKQAADPQLKQHFDAALERATSRAQARLAKDPRERDALFAMTLASGLRADYAALIEKRNFASLHYTREATAWAQKLLAVDPQCYDARIATGISNYIIGSMAAPMRWMLRIGGVGGDKDTGIAELKLTAERGRLLAPFARILLAIAYVRDKDAPRARALLSGLREEFPSNPLFAHEIARLDAGP